MTAADILRLSAAGLLVVGFLLAAVAILSNEPLWIGGSAAVLLVGMIALIAAE